MHPAKHTKTNKNNNPVRSIWDQWLGDEAECSQERHFLEKWSMFEQGFGLLYKWSNLPKVESKRAALQMRSRRLLTTAKKQDSNCHLAVAGYVWDCKDVHKGAFLSLGYLVSTVLEKHEALQSPVRRCLKTRSINAGPTCGSQKITFKSAGSSW